MPVPTKPSSNAATLSAAGWSGAVLAALALIGLMYARSLRTIWIMLLVLGAASVPQAWLALRREQKRDQRRDAD
jgi:4-hydroxybenzoate polyprenyltransferase